MSNTMDVDDIEVATRPSAKAHDNGAVTVKRARTGLVPKHEVEKQRRHRQAQRDYGRGNQINVKHIKDKKLRSNLKALENKYKDAAIKAKDAEILLEGESGFLEPENEMERTWRVTQNEIEESVSQETSNKKFDLKLDQLGPYDFDYDRTGRMLLLGGAKGHIATMDWRQGKYVVPPLCSPFPMLTVDTGWAVSCSWARRSAVSNTFITHR